MTELAELLAALLQQHCSEEDQLAAPLTCPVAPVDCELRAAVET